MASRTNNLFVVILAVLLLQFNRGEIIQHEPKTTEDISNGRIPTPANDLVTMLISKYNSNVQIGAITDTIQRTYHTTYSNITEAVSSIESGANVFKSRLIGMNSLVRSTDGNEVTKVASIIEKYSRAISSRERNFIDFSISYHKILDSIEYDIAKLAKMDKDSNVGWICSGIDPIGRHCSIDDENVFDSVHGGFAITSSVVAVVSGGYAAVLALLGCPATALMGISAVSYFVGNAVVQDGLEKALKSHTFRQAKHDMVLLYKSIQAQSIVVHGMHRNLNIWAQNTKKLSILLNDYQFNDDNQLDLSSAIDRVLGNLEKVLLSCQNFYRT